MAVAFCLAKVFVILTICGISSAHFDDLLDRIRLSKSNDPEVRDFLQTVLKHREDFRWIQGEASKLHREDQILPLRGVPNKNKRAFYSTARDFPPYANYGYRMSSYKQDVPTNDAYPYEEDESKIFDRNLDEEIENENSDFDVKSNGQNYGRIKRQTNLEIFKNVDEANSKNERKVRTINPDDFDFDRKIRNSKNNLFDADRLLEEKLRLRNLLKKGNTRINSGDFEQNLGPLVEVISDGEKGDIDAPGNKYEFKTDMRKKKCVDNPDEHELKMENDTIGAPLSEFYYSAPHDILGIAQEIQMEAHALDKNCTKFKRSATRKSSRGIHFDDILNRQKHQKPDKTIKIKIFDDGRLVKNVKKDEGSHSIVLTIRGDHNDLKGINQPYDMSSQYIKDLDRYSNKLISPSKTALDSVKDDDTLQKIDTILRHDEATLKLNAQIPVPLKPKPTSISDIVRDNTFSEEISHKQLRRNPSKGSVFENANEIDRSKPDELDGEESYEYRPIPVTKSNRETIKVHDSGGQSTQKVRENYFHKDKKYHAAQVDATVQNRLEDQTEPTSAAEQRELGKINNNFNQPNMDIITTEKMLIIPFKKKSSDYENENNIDLDNEEDLEKLRQIHKKFRVKESKDMIHNKEYPVQKRYSSLEFSPSTATIPVALHLKNADDVLDKLKVDLEKTIKSNFDKKHAPNEKVNLLANDDLKSALVHLLDEKNDSEYRNKRDNGEDEDYEDIDKGEKDDDVDESEETLRNKRNVESFNSRSLKSIDYPYHASFPSKRSLTDLFGMSNDEDYSEDKVDYYDFDVKRKRSQNSLDDIFASTVAFRPVHHPQNSKKRNYAMFKKKPKTTKKVAKKDVHNFEEKFNLFTKNIDLIEKADSGTKYENDDLNRNIRTVKEIENFEDNPKSVNQKVLYLNIGRKARKSKSKNVFSDAMLDDRSKKSSETISNDTENDDEKEKKDTSDSKQTDFVLKEDTNNVDSSDEGEPVQNEEDLRRCDKMNLKNQKEPLTNSVNADNPKNFENITANNSTKTESEEKDEDNDLPDKSQVGNELDIIEKTQAILLHITNPPNKSDGQESKGDFDENDDSNSKVECEKPTKPNRDDAGLKVNHKKMYKIIDNPDEDVVGEIMRIVNNFKEKSSKSGKKQKQDKRNREEDDSVAIGAHHHVQEDKKHHAHVKNSNNCNVLKSGSDHIGVYHQKNTEEADFVAPKPVREAFVDVETTKEKYNVEVPEEEEESFHVKRILRNGNENPLRFTPDNIESFKAIVEDSPNSDSKSPEVNIRLDSDREKRYLKHLYNSTNYIEKGKRSKREVSDEDDIDIDHLLAPLKPSIRNKRYKNYYYNPYSFENLLRFKQDSNGNPIGSSAAPPIAEAPPTTTAQQLPPASEGAAQVTSNYGTTTPAASQNSSTECSTITESTCIPISGKPTCKPKKKPKKNKNDCLADETYDLRTNLNKESDREMKLREQNREKLKNDRMMNKQKDKERFKNILNGHIINEIIADFQNRLKENEKLNARFGNTIGKQCVQEQVVIIDKFREDQSKKDVKHAQLMLHQVIVMLNKIVADQVHRRTCLVLPPVLHDFLNTVATPRSSSKSNQIAEGYPLPHITGTETNRFGPSADDKQGEFLFANSDNAQNRLNNDLSMKKKINLIKKLLNKYDHMAESCQVKVEPVKDYLLEHLTMLERLNKEKKLEEEDNICTVHPDYLKKCNSTAAPTTPKSHATTPTISTVVPVEGAKPTSAAAVTHEAPPAQRSFYKRPYQRYPLKYRYGQSKEKKALSDKYRRLVEAADTYRRKRQIEKRLAKLFGERKRKSVGEKQNDAENINDIAFESPVVYSVDE